MEFFEKHANQHSGNNAIYNLFKEAKERGVYKPFIVTVGLGIALITLLLPLSLVLFTKFLSVFHRKSSRLKNIEGNSRNNIETKEKKGEDERKVAQEIRVRISDINRHLYLVGGLSAYLKTFYTIETKVLLGEILEKFYPVNHLLYNKAFEAFGRLNFNDKDKRYEFVEKWFVKPILLLYYYFCGE